MDATDREPALRASVGHVVAAVGAEIRNLPRRERDAWALVLAVALADVVLTAVGIRQGLAEGNPLMAYAIGIGGIAALFIAKALVLTVAGLVRYRRPQDGTAIALGLAIPWLAAVCINTALIL